MTSYKMAAEFLSVHMWLSSVQKPEYFIPLIETKQGIFMLIFFYKVTRIQITTHW